MGPDFVTGEGSFFRKRSQVFLSFLIVLKQKLGISDTNLMREPPCLGMCIGSAGGGNGDIQLILLDGNRACPGPNRALGG